MAIILNIDNTRSDIKPEGSKNELTLNQIQKIIGGYAESVRVPNSHNFLLVDEDGLMKRLTINIEASNLAQRPIVGPAILCVDIDGEIF